MWGRRFRLPYRAKPDGAFFACALGLIARTPYTTWSDYGGSPDSELEANPVGIPAVYEVGGRGKRGYYVFALPQAH